jgi:hypothetical protein
MTEVECMDYQDLTLALQQWIALVVQKTSGHLPSIMGAIALLIGGRLVARILCFSRARVIGGLDSRMRRYRAGGCIAVRAAHPGRRSDRARRILTWRCGARRGCRRCDGAGHNVQSPQGLMFGVDRWVSLW